MLKLNKNNQINKYKTNEHITNQKQSLYCATLATYFCFHILRDFSLCTQAA